MRKLEFSQNDLQLLRCLGERHRSGPHHLLAHRRERAGPVQVEQFAFDCTESGENACSSLLLGRNIEEGYFIEGSTALDFSQPLRIFLLSELVEGYL